MVNPISPIAVTVLPPRSQPIDDAGNLIDTQWYQCLFALFQRTGGAGGFDLSTVETTANDALELSSQNATDLTATNVQLARNTAMAINANNTAIIAESTSEGNQQAITGIEATALFQSGNLAMLASVPTARTNLGVDTFPILIEIDSAAPSASGTVTLVDTGTGLTGGPISTTGTIALASTTVTAGSYTNASLTVDAQGRLTAAASGTAPVTSVGAGTGLGTTGGTTPTLSLANTAVTAGSYTLADITIDAQGRITAASNGSGGSGTVTSVATGTGLTGGPISTTGTIALASTTVTAASYVLGSFTVNAEGQLTAASSASATSGQLLIGQSSGPPTAQSISGDVSAITAAGVTTVSSVAGHAIGTSGGTLPLLNANNTFSGTNTFSTGVVTGSTFSLNGQQTAIAAGQVGELMTNTNGGGTIANNAFNALTSITLGRGNWLCWMWVAVTSVSGDVLNATIGLVTDGSNNAEQGSQAPTVVNGANIVNPGPLYVPDRGSSQTVHGEVYALTGGGGNPTVGPSTLYALRIS